MSRARAARKVAKDVYRGYMPIDLPQNRPPNRIKPWWKVLGKPRLTMYPKPEIEEYSQEPEYPPLNEASKEGLRAQVRLDWYETLKTLPTVEQKLYEIDRHASHRMAHINNWLPTCNSLPFAQYLTRTHLIESLPNSYGLQVGKGEIDGPSVVDGTSKAQELSHIDERIKQTLLEQIVLEKYETKQNEHLPFISKSIQDGNRKSFISNRLVQNVFNQVKKLLVCETNPQLLEYQVDLSPAIRSWWYHSGFQATSNKPFYRNRKDKDGNINTIFQMDGSAALTIRSESLIEPMLSMDDPLVTDTSLVKASNFDPRHYGAFYKFKWPVSLPGFWFEDEPRFDCPHTCLLTTDSLKLRHELARNLASPLKDKEDFLTSQAVLTAFGWLNSLSMYHGYTPFQEIDYPLTCQVITTDGQDWLFNVFQLNTHAFHRDLGGPKRNNVCWSSGVMRLYESYSDGKFDGINVDVVQTLTKFLSKQVSADYTRQLNLRPYLGTDTRDPEEKDQMRKRLRAMFEGRTNRWRSNDWNVPLFEHIFFRAKESRFQIRHMKPKWHTPKPQFPKIFE
uniref:28S ribosomal protein S30, mitochondrial n=1 Tax=Aceria tosichella TaxID=561515 RepID=A0A6G1SAJ4_9ACAR